MAPSQHDWKIVDRDKTKVFFHNKFYTNIIQFQVNAYQILLHTFNYHLAWIDLLFDILKSVLYQQCGSRAPLCDDSFLFFMRQRWCVVCKTALHRKKIQRCKKAAMSKSKFSTCSFSMRFFAILGGCKTAALGTQFDCKTPECNCQATQGVLATDVRFLHPRICNTRAERLLQDYNVMALCFIPWLTQECREMYGYRWKLQAALHVNLR